MRVGEWDTLGRARALLQRQLGDLDATEYAAHVAINQDTGRLRILVAADVGLLEYSYAPQGADPEGPWLLRGTLHRWSMVKALRLQTDAQMDDESGEIRALWRLIADEPKMELSADSAGEGEHAPAGLLPFAKACLDHVS
jgi:hypothetical protein